MDPMIPMGKKIIGKPNLQYLCSMWVFSGVVLLMAEIWRFPTWDGAENPINNGKNYQPQLVNAGVQPSTV